MLACINKSSLEYQTLKDKSGIQDDTLEAICRDFITKYNRFPYLDELPNANSEPYLKYKLKINQYSGTKIDNILEFTGVNTVEEANHTINDQYRDLEVTITPLNKEALVDIEHKPTTTNFDVTPVTVDNSIDNHLVISNTLNKLSKLYGIKFNTVTNAELRSPKWKDLITDVSSVNAFIYSNEIYINIDRYTADSPIHELMHMLVGSMRFTNPNLYQSLIDSIEQYIDFNNLPPDYKSRTRNDIKEEIFVTEVSRYLTGQSSAINELNDTAKYEIMYNTKRVLDTILMGQDSVKTISDGRLFQMTLKELTQEVNSSIMTNQFKGFINLEGSSLHRKLNNLKSDLMKQNKLEEICD